MGEYYDNNYGSENKGREAAKETGRESAVREAARDTAREKVTDKLNTEADHNDPHKSRMNLHKDDDESPLFVDESPLLKDHWYVSKNGLLKELSNPGIELYDLLKYSNFGDNDLRKKFINIKAKKKKSRFMQ